MLLAFGLLKNKQRWFCNLLFWDSLLSIFRLSLQLSIAYWFCLVNRSIAFLARVNTKFNKTKSVGADTAEVISIWV